MKAYLASIAAFAAMTSTMLAEPVILSDAEMAQLKAVTAGSKDKDNTPSHLLASKVRTAVMLRMARPKPRPLRGTPSALANVEMDQITAGGFFGPTAFMGPVIQASPSQNMITGSLYEMLMNSQQR